jgi:NTE family protein
LPFVAVATDLANQREVWLTNGPLFDVIRASIAIPMVFTPYRVQGRDLVDGGLLAPIPIAATRMFAADLVLAVDANSHSGNGLSSAAKKAGKPAEKSEVPNSGVRARVEAFVDSILDRGSSEPAQPGLLDLMSSSLDTVQARISQMQLALDPPDILVRIPHHACFFYEFWKAREMIEVGREAATLALDRFEQGHR